MLPTLKNNDAPGEGNSDPPLFTGPSLPTLIIDSENLRIKYANEAALKFYRYEANTVLALVFTELLETQSQTIFFREISTHAPEFSCSLIHLRKKGRPIRATVKVSLVAIGDAQHLQLNIIGLKEKVIKAGSDLNAQDKLRLMARLVEETSDVLTAADIEFKPTTWNKAAEKIYGLKAEEVIGKDLRNFIRLNYFNSDREEVRAVIAKEGEWRGEAFFIRPTDNKTITLLMSFKSLKNENGDTTCYLISATDITERKDAESRLRESESRFRDMADSSPAMIWMTDENNLTSYTNKKWIEFTGKDITGIADGWSRLVHKEDIAKTTAHYYEAFESRKEITLIYRLQRADGSYCWVHDLSMPRFLADGKFIGFIGSVVDIEDQKQKQEQLLYQATILENVSDIIVTTDLDFKIKVWNKIAEHYYEIPEEEAIGKSIKGLIPFHYNGTTAQEALADLNTYKIWQGEVSITNKRDETKYFFHTVKYVYDENGNEIGVLSVGRDITDRKLADAKLIKSEQFYRTLIADSLDGMILLNPTGGITFCSPSVKNILGFEVEEVVGKNAFEFVHPEDITWALDSFQKEVIENPEVKFITVRLKKRNDEWVWCMVRGHNLLKNPFINSIVVYFHDDTLRKQASSALKRSEKRFRDLIRDLQIGVVMQDKEGKVLLCNKAFTEIFSASEEEMIGKNMPRIAMDPVHEDGTAFLPEERPTHKALYAKHAQKDVVMGIYQPGSKERKWVMINADPVLDENGSILHIICSVKDITERKKMEADQMAKQINHQRQLTQASIDGQENERREIGKELHDNVGQQLTTIKLFLDLAKTTADETTNEMLSMALKGVSDVINEVRTISRSLVPSTLKDLGLIESVDELVDSIKRTQVLNIESDYFNFDEEHLPENQKLTLFRIIQEQLNNVVKHSGAKKVWIEISNSNNELVLKIRDNGTGFDLKKIRKGLGFMNIKNRAELFQGKAEIFSQPGKGCLLKVSMPFNYAQPHAPLIT